MWQPGEVTSCTRCGECCEFDSCGLAPTRNGKCIAYYRKGGIPTCRLAEESAAIREELEIGQGCHFYLLNWLPMDGEFETEACKKANRYSAQTA